jgi:hypothetical protein
MRRPDNGALRDVLNATYLHANMLHLRDAAALIAKNPHTMLTLPPAYEGVLHFLPRPKVLTLVRGPLVVACY